MADDEGIAEAQSVLRAQAPNADGTLTQCASILMANIAGMRLFQAVQVLSQLRASGWLVSVDADRDRIAE